MDTKKISVIIPIYNAEKYIARCLNSILENTYHNLEVLCINDGSTDQSEKILQNFADRDDRIKILTQSNQGVSAARNCGLDAATGDYIAFIDADDWVHKQYFEYLINACLDTGTSISVCKFFITSDDNYSNTISEYEQQSEIFSVERCFKVSYIKIFVWGKIISRAIIGNIRFENTLKFGEDTVWMLRVLCENPKIHICFINSMLYYYYQHNGPRGSFAPSEMYLPMVDTLLMYAKKINDQKSLSALILKEEAMKKLFTYRYEARIERKFTDARHNFNVRFSTLRKDIKQFPFKKRIMYEILGVFPFVYRALRIMQDKTLLEWEKQKPKLLAEYNANNQES